jgi:hypothetical protein
MESELNQTLNLIKISLVLRLRGEEQCKTILMKRKILKSKTMEWNGKESASSVRKILEIVCGGTSLIEI